MNINILKTILSMISEMFAPHVESVLHDMQSENYTILAIYNNSLSGRKIGDGSSVFGPLDINEKIQPDKVVNYQFAAPNGKKFRSSSLIIRNENHKAIFGISLNYDTANIDKAINILSQFSGQLTDKNTQTTTLTTSITKEILNNEISKIKMKNNIISQHLSKKDIKLIIQDLFKAKYFEKHGVTTLLSKELNLTRPTVYKYLKAIQSESS
jgi:predicted transcriptional regulator YheO